MKSIHLITYGQNMTETNKTKPTVKLKNASVKKKLVKPAVKVATASVKKPLSVLQKIEVPNASTVGFLHEMQRQPL